MVSLALVVAPSRAHVGSPNVFFDGDAGPYPVRVVVRPPSVIPADAEVTVRLRSPAKVDRVTLQPSLFKAGFRGAPPPEEAKAVAEGVWSLPLLLMKEGSWRVRVELSGERGQGTVEVPVPAVRREIFEMSEQFGGLLAGLGVILVLGAASILGSAVRESSLAPGETPSRSRILASRIATLLGAVALAFLVWGGKRWWDSTEAALRAQIFAPFDLSASIVEIQGHRQLTLEIADPRGPQEWWPLIPDHGKLMHLFLSREDGLDAFAHLHPTALEQQRFASALPPLPAGTYRVHADIVDENGFPQTLVSRVELPDLTGAEPLRSSPPATDAAAGEKESTDGATTPLTLDPDDSWRLSETLAAGIARKRGESALDDGGTMRWLRWPSAAPVANEETTLEFEVRAADGSPAVLEPYMGMLGHAVVQRDDGTVFVHLHPMGTVNMAAQQVLSQGLGGESEGDPTTIDHSRHAPMGSMGTMHHSAPSTLSFPFEFPKPGRYRVWVQVKSQGRVLTGVFAVDVTES